MLFSRSDSPLGRPTIVRRNSIFSEDAPGASSVHRVLGGLVVCLVVASLLGSSRLVAMAERQDLGPARDRWLTAAHAVDRVASALSLDRPADAVEGALGRSSSPSTVVLGALAADSGERSELTATTPPATTVPTPTSVAPTTVPPTTAPATSAAALETTTTAAPTTTTTAAPTTTTTAPPVFGTVSFDQPLRAWFGGDSLGEYVGSRILHREADPALTDIELDYHIATGLSRPDVFDWPSRLSEVMQREDAPQLLVFMVGGNDDQDMQTGDQYFVRNTDEWFVEYRRRVATIMDVVAYPDTQLVWINLPPMQSELRQEIAAGVNEILAEEAALRPWVSVTDTVALLSGPEGGFSEFLQEPSGDLTIRARADDGVHITIDGSRWVAEAVWSHVLASWTFPGAAAPAPLN